MTPLDQAIAAVRAALPSDAMPVADPLVLAVERLLVEMEWQPIATAPKDGTPFLTFSQDAANDPRESVLGAKSTPILVMAWVPTDGRPYPVDECGDWHDFHNWEPTHWMPLPAPPEA